MNINIPSSWLYPRTVEEAQETQKYLASRLHFEDAFDPIQTIAGMDVSNDINDPQEIIHAVAVSLDQKTLTLQEQTSVSEVQSFPYIPGLLGFREAPALIGAYKLLKQAPQVIMIDGHGISHPRKLGIASHIGILLDVPTIGVAKSILIGKPAFPLGPQPGDQAPLVWKGQTIAMLLRTKRRCNPLIISTGHRVSLETAICLVQECLKGYRLPEPTRQAHLAANQVRRQFSR